MMSKNKRWTANDIQLVIMAGLSVVFLFVFAYMPMAGIALAFKQGDKALNILDALFNAPWTLNNFTSLFANKTFWQVFTNTLSINVLLLVFNFPMPIIFALLINEIRVKWFKKSVQTILNFPHFISWVIYGGIIIELSNPDTGIINSILEFLKLSSAENPLDLNLAQYFYPKIIIASILKGVGWGSIIYLAAIAGIDQELYSAALIDGANRWQMAMKITLPMIFPTISVFLLLNIAGLLNNSFEQFYVFQTTANIERTRVLATYMYTLGFTNRNFSTATALSLFEGLISLVLLTGSNFISKKLTGEGIY